ncbi:MAG: hypothetical protein EU548_01165 [Promethearchaeota archaeon]|nr:MAG: hypothetical protein EU548_01165 [Candidatus Lokiarchaeota archaeon]
MSDPVDIEDLEAFIDGLKHSFDSLGSGDPMKSKGFQSSIARAISSLRMKKAEKARSEPEILGHFTTKDLKVFLINKLEQLKSLLDEYQKYPSRKFKLVMEIAKLRERISSL